MLSFKEVECRRIETHLGVLLHWNSSGEHEDRQTSSEPSPQSSSLSHTHWEGMQRPPAQVNSVSKHGGEGGWQGTPSHCHKPSTQELHRAKTKTLKLNFIHCYHTLKCLILFVINLPVLAVLSNDSSRWENWALPLTWTLRGIYTMLSCRTEFPLLTHCSFTGCIQHSPSGGQMHWYSYISALWWDI